MPPVLQRNTIAQRAANYRRIYVCDRREEQIGLTAGLWKVEMCVPETRRRDIIESGERKQRFKGESTVRIVDADIAALSNAAKRGRVRSPETQQLIDTIDSMSQGTAKAILLEPGQTGQKVRSRLAYAARIAGKRLQIVIQEDRVLFALSQRRARRQRRKAGS